jgi:phosphopantetheinyl transferase
MLVLPYTDDDGSCVAVAQMPEGGAVSPVSFFSAQEEQEYRQLGSVRRMRERAATLRLLHRALGVEDALHHSPNGKPYLSAGSRRISISHTRGWVALALHPCREAGVDVESMLRSFEKVAPRYLSADELAGCTSQAQLCLAWCAKETVYKLAGEEGVDFAAQIRLSPFDVSPEGCIAAFFAGRSKAANFTIRYRIVGELAVCYAFA